MTKRNLTVFLLLFVFCITTACGQIATPPPTPEPADNTAASVATPSPSPVPTPEFTLEPTPTPDPVEEVLAGMTVEQKVGQLLVAGIEGLVPGEDAVSAIQDYQVGGVILFSRNVENAEQLTALTNSLRELNGDAVPLFLCVDEEGGLVSRMPAEVTDLPSAYTYGQTEDTELWRSLGQALGSACAAFGFNVDFAPVMDVWSNPDNTVIGTRAYSSDPDRAAACAAEVAAGLEEAGVIATGKHFPGHGDTAVDSHKELPVVDKSREEWEQSDAVPFQAAIASGVPMLMVGHILMTPFDPERPASLSPTVVTALLREEMGFEGVVCTDDLTMGAITNTYGLGEAAVLAVEAGCDLLLVCHDADNLTQARDALLQAVEDGRISQARLDESVRRILSLKAEYGLSNDPVEPPDVDSLNAMLAAVLPDE